MAPNETSASGDPKSFTFLKPGESIESKMNDRNNNTDKIDGNQQFGQCTITQRHRLLQHTSTTTTQSTTMTQLMTNGVDTKEDYYEATELVETSSDQVYKPKIRWPDLLAQLFLHMGALYGLYYLITFQSNIRTFFWGMCFLDYN